MGSIFLLALWAAIYPTLLACVVVILLLPRPERLLLGFWLGAMAMSVTCGLIVVFALGGSSGATTTTKHTISPIVEIVFGAILLLLALVFFSGRDQRYNARRERKHEAKAKKAPSKAMQVLQRGTPRTTFVVGAVVIGIPGVSYLTAMDLLSRRHVSTLVAVLVVLAWNVIMLLLLEVPIVAYAFAPQDTAEKVESFKTWLTRDESRIAYWCALIAGGCAPCDRRRSPLALTRAPPVKRNADGCRYQRRRISGGDETTRFAAYPRSRASSCRRQTPPRRVNRCSPDLTRPKSLVVGNQPFRPMTRRCFRTYGQPTIPSQPDNEITQDPRRMTSIALPTANPRGRGCFRETYEGSADAGDER